MATAASEQKVVALTRPNFVLQADKPLSLKSLDYSNLIKLIARRTVGDYTPLSDRFYRVTSIV